MPFRYTFERHFLYLERAWFFFLCDPPPPHPLSLSWACIPSLQVLF